MGKRLFIGYESALYFWLRGSKGLWSSSPCRAASLSQCAYNASDVGSFRIPREAFGPTPLHIMVDACDKRRAASDCIFHVWSAPIAQKSFVDIGHGVFVASPTFCFIQVANRLSLFNLAELGYELCGTYLRTPGIGNGFAQRAYLLATPQSINWQLHKMPHMAGGIAVKRVIPYIVQGSASPAETDMALKNHLPPRMGGYGFPLAELNALVRPTDEAVSIVGKRKLYPDALWRNQKTCLEYDSSLHHERREDRVRDSIKRNALGCMGYTVITVTPTQLKSVEQYHGVAVEVARHLGFRIRTTSQSTLNKRFELNEEIKRRMAEDAKPIEWPYYESD